MKKKSRFLVHIALIALSLCIMVYGVYAAKQASLTVSGTIGFTAHGVNLRVSDLKVANALDANGATYALAADQQYKETTMSTTDVSEIAIVNPMYFDDLSASTATADNIPAIKISFKVYNLSRFAVALEEVKTATALPLANNTTSTNVKYTATAAYVTGATSMAASTNGTEANTAGGTCVVTIELTYGNGYTDSAATNLALESFKLALAFKQATAGA